MEKSRTQTRLENMFLSDVWKPDPNRPGFVAHAGLLTVSIYVIHYHNGASRVFKKEVVGMDSFTREMPYSPDEFEAVWYKAIANDG
jgi:hypothetical protein